MLQTESVVREWQRQLYIDASNTPYMKLLKSIWRGRSIVRGLSPMIVDHHPLVCIRNYYAFYDEDRTQVHIYPDMSLSQLEASRVKYLNAVERFWVAHTADEQYHIEIERLRTEFARFRYMYLVDPYTFREEIIKLHEVGYSLPIDIGVHHLSVDDIRLVLSALAGKEPMNGIQIPSFGDSHAEAALADYYPCLSLYEDQVGAIHTAKSSIYQINSLAATIFNRNIQEAIYGHKHVLQIR